MSRDFTNSSSNFLSHATGTPNLTGTAITMHAWINADTVTGTRHVCGRWGNAIARRQTLIQINSSKVLVAVGDAAGNDNVSGATNVSTGVWHPIGMRKNGTGAGALSAWLDGSSNGSTTSNRSAQSLGAVTGTQWRVGLDSNSTNPFDGRIAEVAAWTVALSDAEMVALAKGVCPLLIRRADLKIYTPIWAVGASTDEVDFSGAGLNLTVNGTLNLADHAPVGRIAV